MTAAPSWSLRQTCTSTSTTCGCRRVARGNATHGPAVVGTPVHQMVREADGDAVLSTGTEVPQNLSPQKLNVLEENGGNGEKGSLPIREEEEKPERADAEPLCAPARWSRSSGCSAEPHRFSSGPPAGAEGPHKGLCHRVSASAEAGPDELGEQRIQEVYICTRTWPGSPAGPPTVPDGKEVFLL